jgi:hypothetical protein
MFRRSLAIALAFLLTGISLPGQTVPLGVVTQSSGGHLNNTAASVGSSIYESDRLSTEPAGVLALGAGPVQLTLAGDSTVLMNRDGAGLVVTAGKETRVVEEGKSYRVLLEGGACNRKPPSPCGSRPFPRSPYCSGCDHHHRLAQSARKPRPSVIQLIHNSTTPPREFSLGL